MSKFQGSPSGTGFPPVLEDLASSPRSDGHPADWQVTARVHLRHTGGQSSRDLPTFTIPRALAPTRGDAESKARDILNPWRSEDVTYTADIYGPDGAVDPVPALQRR